MKTKRIYKNEMKLEEIAYDLANQFKGDDDYKIFINSRSTTVLDKVYFVAVITLLKPQSQTELMYTYLFEAPVISAYQKALIEVLSAIRVADTLKEILTSMGSTPTRLRIFFDVDADPSTRDLAYQLFKKI